MELVHYKEYQNDQWPLEYFTPLELSCNHCGRIADGPEQRRAWKSLDYLRHQLGYPLRVTSGTRCVAHNQAVGGARASKHLEGLAFDLSPLSEVRFPQFEVEAIYCARECGFHGIGIYSRFIHLDTRTPRSNGLPVVWWG